MDSVKATAHRAGMLYFAFMIVAIIGEFVLGGFVVPGDAAATAEKILANERTYRLQLLVAFVTLVVFILLISSLYKLFRDVDRGLARLMVLFVSIGIAIALANLQLKFAPLVLLSGADYLSTFTKQELDALVLSVLRWHGAGAALATAFWGIWLFPFGMLVIRSGYFPRILGYLLIIAGVGYVVTSVTSIVLPEHRGVVSRVMMPLYFGEIPIIFWLLIKGARITAPEQPLTVPGHVSGNT